MNLVKNENLPVQTINPQRLMPAWQHCYQCLVDSTHTDRHKKCPRCGWGPDAKSEAAEDAVEEAPGREPEMVPGPGFKNLEELNVGQLRPMARDLGVKHWYRLGKDKLLKAVKAAKK